MSLLSTDDKVAERLGNKALELLSQAETAAAEDDRDSSSEPCGGDNGAEAL